MRKMFAAMTTVVCVVLAGYCLQLFRENNRNNDDANRFAQQRDDVQEKLKSIQSDINERELKHDEVVDKLISENELLGSTRKGLEAEIARLMRVLASNSEKVDRVELEKLRELRQIVEENIEASQVSLDRIKKALPKDRTWWSDPVGKSKELLPGTQRPE